ncbi:MAG: small ribosomal subunit Rsm22 family protein [Myxococcota bacterium]
MGDAMRDLEKWIPRLLAVWRRHRRGARGASGRHGERPGRHVPQLPEAQLTHEELKEVSTGVKALSHGLTRDRELAGARYMDDPKLLGAYLLFYWPVSYAQARATLSELPGRPRATLDLGSGPAPVAFAALDAGASGVVAADRSRSALELAKALAIEASEPLSTREWAPERPLPEGQFELITMGHVLNELFSGDIGKRAALVEKVLERVTKGGTLLILEPALRETSRALLQVRDLLVSHGAVVRSPCLWRGACPALVKPSDWCHAEREWRLPPMVEAIGRAAGLRKETLKMSYLALASRGEAWAEPPEGQLFRIVSEPLEGKGRQRFMGCGPSGRVGLALQERHETERNRLFFKLRRGDVVRVTATEERGDGLALSDASTVEIVANAGRPVPPR